MRLTLALFLVAAGCAARPATTASRSPAVAAPQPVASVATTPPVCPTVPLVPRPVHPHPSFDTSQTRCADPTPTPDVSSLPFGRDIDDTLYCLDALYDGPEALPLDAMLAAAMAALPRAYPAVQVTTTPRGSVVRAAGRSLSVAPPRNAHTLLWALVGVARFVRDAIPEQTFASAGNPEHVLIFGALGALAWRTQFIPPADQPVPPTAMTSGRPQYPPQPMMSRVGEGLFYLRTGQFQLGMAKRFREALARAGDVRGIVLDLRGSPGGLFAEAIALGDLFARHGCLAVLRSSEQSESRVARDERDDIDAPLVVLIDHLSSAGAESLAGTLRAQRRAVLVGERTTGDGIIQVLYDVGKGAQLVIPIAELMSGDGTSFQGRGIDPDLPIPDDQTLAADGDPGLAYAVRLLTRAHGGGRDQLLQAR
jgi:hypothetical protein